MPSRQLIVRCSVRVASLGFLLAAAGSPAAEPGYITDRISTPLRVNPVTDAQTVGEPLSSGMPVEILQRSPDGKWARVRFQQMEGWLPGNLLQSTQAARDQLAELQARYDALAREQKGEDGQMKDLQAEVQALRAQLSQAKADRDTALRQLGDLKFDSAEPQQLAASNRQLGERASQLDIDNERMSNEIRRLEDDHSSSFLLYGGLIVFGGVVIGWLLGRQPGRRSGW